MKIQTLAPVVIGLLISGCASVTSDYSPPAPINTIQTSKVVAGDYDAVWRRLIAAVAQDFFVINNLDKDSGLVNLSFSADRPSDYVDCGRMQVEVDGLPGQPWGDGNFNFSDSARYSSALNGTPLKVTRKADLAGRANVVLSTTDGETQATVNVKYALNIGVVVRDYAGRYVGKRDVTATFSSKKRAFFENSQATCNSKGVVERKLLDMVK